MLIILITSFIWVFDKVFVTMCVCTIITFVFPLKHIEHCNITNCNVATRRI